MIKKKNKNHSHSFFLDNFLRRLFQNPSKIVGEYINKGDTVFEIGCGPGFFTIDIAKLVGISGKVIAIDKQQHMLDKNKKKAIKYDVSDRIEFHLSNSKDIGLNKKADFIFLYYTVHAVENIKTFLSQVKDLLKENGEVLIVEPNIHVEKEYFKNMIKIITKIGFKIKEYPQNKGGKAVLLGL